MPMPPPTPPIETPEAYRAKEQESARQQIVPIGLMARAGVKPTGPMVESESTLGALGPLLVLIIILFTAILGNL